jgi:hypothetical protein
MTSKRKTSVKREKGKQREYDNEKNTTYFVIEIFDDAMQSENSREKEERNEEERQ